MNTRKRKCISQSEILLKKNKELSSKNKKQKLEIEILQAQNKYLLERIENAKVLEAFTKCDFLSCTEKVKDFTPYCHPCRHVLCNACKEKPLCLVCCESKQETLVNDTDGAALSSEDKITNTEIKTEIIIEENHSSASKNVNTVEDNVMNKTKEDNDLNDVLSVASDESVYSPGQNLPSEEM